MSVGVAGEIMKLKWGSLSRTENSLSYVCYSEISYDCNVNNQIWYMPFSF